MNYKMIFLTLLLSSSFAALTAMSTDTTSTSTSSDSSSSSSSSSDSDWGNTGWAGFQRERINVEYESGY